jgi:hypothetical protein
LPNSPYWGTTTVGPDGTVYVAGRTWSGPPFSTVAWSTAANDPTVPVTFDGVAHPNLGGQIVAQVADSPNPGGLLGQLWIEVDRSGGPNHGNIYLLASVRPPGDDPLDVRFSRSTDGGTTWSQPIRVHDDPTDSLAWQWFGTMSVAPNGRIDAVWNDTRNDSDGYDSELFYSFSDDGGLSWSPDEVVSPAFDPHVGWPNQNKIGDYYQLSSDLTGTNLIWSATFNGEQDVYFLRIGERDCNSNGISDSAEPDADGDSIIDDCDNCPELANPRQTDRNDNDVGDACDVYVFGDDFEWGSDRAWSATTP